MNLVLCAWFPNWPVQRVVREQPEKGRGKGETLLVLHSPSETAPKVIACSRRAARLGIHPGMPLAEARGLTPRGDFQPHDPAADRDHLRRLAWQCLTWTPRAGLDSAEPPESLFLDLTGCVPHLGDSQQFGRQVRTHFETQQYDVRIAIAPTWGAAWAIAREENRDRKRRGTSREKTSPAPASSDSPIAVIEDRDAIRQRLRPLPIDRLRLPAGTLASLEESGLGTIGSLLDLSRSAIPSRYGEALRRLDQALGSAEELLQPELPPVPVRSVARFENPIADMTVLQHVLRRQLEELGTQLTRRRQETQQVQVFWKTEERDTEEFEIRLLRPTASPRLLWELLWLRVESLSLTAGLAELEMEAVPCLPERLRQSTLFEDDGRRESEFRHLVERLNGRLGHGRSLRFRRVEEFSPEREFLLEPWGEGLESPVTAESNSPERLEPDRPLLVMARPVVIRAVVDEATGRPLRFRWQQRDQVIVLCTGPERIVTGWWRGTFAARDYFRVETTSGSRFWLFFERPAARWFLQGVFE